MQNEKEKTEKPQMKVEPPAVDRVREFILQHQAKLSEDQCRMLSDIAKERDAFSMQNFELLTAIDKSNEQILEQNKLMLQSKFQSYQERINMLLDIIHFMTVKPESGMGATPGPLKERRTPV